MGWLKKVKILCDICGVEIDEKRDTYITYMRKGIKMYVCKNCMNDSEKVVMKWEQMKTK